METERSGMASETHIMAIPLPFQGHMNPMMQLAKRLAAKGLRITFVTPVSNSVQVKTSSINLEYFNLEFDEGDEQPKDPEYYMEHIRRRAQQFLPVLIDKQKSSGWPATVMIHDAHLPLAGEIGHALGLKVAPFFTEAAGVSAVYYHLHLKTSSLIAPMKAGSTVSLPAMPELEINDLPSVTYDGLYPSAMELHTSQFLNLDKASCVLFNTFYELESEVVKWLQKQWQVKTVGPTIPSMYLDKRLISDKDHGLINLFKPDTEACISWLDTKSPGSVVYASFGSLANLGQDYMEEVGWGLLKSNFNFLWVVRDTEKGKLSSNFVDEAAEKGLIVGWCPQLEVLAHKAVGSFMTHCGWNSTLEALSLGVPMLVMPEWNDQPTNAKYIVDVWRTGVQVKPYGKENVTREEIANCIDQVMEGEKAEELRANARRWKELAIRATDEGGSSDKNIDEFISHISST